MIDLAAVRADTPGCERVAHLNNAGSSLPTAAVRDATIDYLRAEAVVGGYELAAREAEAIDRYRPALAELLGASADEIAFAVSDTAAFSQAFWGMWLSGVVAPGSRVLVDRGSYISHQFAFLQAQRHGGLTIDVVPADPTGALDVGALASMLDERVSLVALTHVGTHRGLVNPVEEAGAVLAGHPAVFLLDACQSVGQLRVDVEAIGCDVLTGTGRKFLRAPRGSGVLWVRRDLAERIDPPGVDGPGTAWVAPGEYRLGAGARRFEAYEASFAVKVGLGVAVDYVLRLGIDAVAARVATLGESLRTQLGGIDGVHVLDGGHRRSGIVTFASDRAPAAAVHAALSAAGVNTSISNTSSAQLDAAGRPQEAVRASVHYYNSESEVGRAVDVVAAM